MGEIENQELKEAIKNISPKQKGLNTELHCISYLSDCGFLVSTPYGDNGRYDLIVDVNGHQLRLQVKTCSIYCDADNEPTGIKFSCKSARINTKETYVRRYTKEEIDYFATYFNHKVYVIPVEETTENKIIHFFEPKNNQGYMMSFLEDYTIDKQWSKYIENKKEYPSLKEKIQPNTIYALEPEVENAIIEFAKKENEAKKEYFCARCGAKLNKAATYCSKCANYFAIKVERPDREIRTVPFTELGRKYHVSNKVIAKWCLDEKLPSRKSEINVISDEDWGKL